MIRRMISAMDARGKKARGAKADIAGPTIDEVLKRFLAAQRDRLAPGTFALYRDVVGLLEDCLDRYAYLNLDKTDEKRWERIYNLKGASHREFCGIFGPEHILANIDEFLGYFMIRKVIAGKNLLRAAGSVTKKLALWLAENGYADAGDAREAAASGAEAARNLPRAEDLARLLYEHAESRTWRGVKNLREDHFTLTRVEPGSIWLNDMSGKHAMGPIEVPEEISARCKVGWTVSGAVGRVGKRWRLIEAWNVYPR